MRDKLRSLLNQSKLNEEKKSSLSNNSAQSQDFFDSDSPSKKAFQRRSYSERPEPKVSNTASAGAAVQQRGAKKNPNKPVESQDKQRSTFARRTSFFLKVFMALIILLMGSLVGLVVGAINNYLDDLPRIEMMEDYQPQLPSRMFDGQNRQIADFFKPEQNRQMVTIDQMPDQLINAVVAIEDNEYYNHFGISLRGFARAAYENYKAGTISQGGSTITMQLAEDLIRNKQVPDEYNIPEDMHLRSYRQKIYEVLLSLKLEKRYTKEEILEIYLNQIFLGGNINGVAKAAQAYYGKRIEDLNLKECASFAAMLRAPNRYNPVDNPERAQERTELVLKAMRRHGYITKVEYEEAVAQPFHVNPNNTRMKQQVDFPYYSYGVVSLFNQGTITTPEGGPIEVYGQGVDIYTSVDSSFQRIAEEVLREGIIAQEDYHRQNGGKYFGVTNAPNPYVNELSEDQEYDAKIISAATGTIEFTIPNVRGGQGPFTLSYSPEDTWLDDFDVLKKGYFIRVKPLITEEQMTFRLGQNQHAQGALIAVQPSTGKVLALSGGYNYFDFENNGQFNRALQTHDIQPGSAFKPVVYAAALADPRKAWTVASILKDERIEYFNGWAPRNFERQYFGNVTMRRALAHSMNAATVWLMSKLRPTFTQSYNYFRNFCYQAFDLEISAQTNLAISLGTEGTTPLELAQAYQVFANGGNFNKLHLVDEIVQRSEHRDYKKILYQYKQPYVGMERITPEVAYLVTYLLRGVIEEGNAGELLEMPFYAVGKTGTTTDYTYAWFAGYSNDILCIVYVGYDDFKLSLGNRRTGSRVAMPIWRKFMERTYELRPDLFGEIETPDQIVYKDICTRTGLLAGNPDIYTGAGRAQIAKMPFIKGTEPKSVSPYYRRAAPAPTPFVPQQVQQPQQERPAFQPIQSHPLFGN